MGTVWKDNQMKQERFIGRSKEKEILEEYFTSQKSEFVAIYGRRRVGKTYLVKETLGERLDFEFSGMYQVPAKIQIREFQKKLNNRSGKRTAPPKDWFEAFDHLQEYLIELGKPSVAVFLDELPWMDTAKSNFLAALSAFWNGWTGRKNTLKLYVCGSATTWMVDKLIGDKGGLYGRLSRSIYLRPFTLYETEQYLNQIKHMKYGPKLVLDTYMILGGIPYYLDMLDGKKPLNINIDNLFFAENAPLKTEFEFLFRSLFKDSLNYRKVIEFISTKLIGQTREEIAAGCKLEGGELSKILNNLSLCDFIRSYSAPKKKERSRMYQLTDMFSLFYLRFVQNGEGLDENFWSNQGQTGKKSAWSGYAFEQVCLLHINQIKVKLGISGILSNAYAWSCKSYTDSEGNSWRGGQIDLIIDRNDGVMNLCEMKYSADEFIISADYAQTVRNRTAMFKSTEKVRKDLRCTFVTPFGIKRNMNSDIVDDQIKLEDLFT